MPHAEEGARESVIRSGEGLRAVQVQDKGDLCWGKQG